MKRIKWHKASHWNIQVVQERNLELMELDNKRNFNEQELWEAPEPNEVVGELLTAVMMWEKCSINFNSRPVLKDGPGNSCAAHSRDTFLFVFIIKDLLKLGFFFLSGHIPCWKEQYLSHVVRNTHLANDLMQQGYGMMLFAAVSD